MRLTHLVAVITACAVLTLPAPAEATAATPTYGGKISRSQVIARAADWLRKRLPYSQDNARARWDANYDRKYRPDCSGLVSMAWALDTRRFGRALVTWELPGVSRKIAWSKLRRGDILLHLDPGDPGEEHVVLVQAWANRSRSKVWIIEESASYGGVRRRKVDVAAAKGFYAPYRYKRIT